MARRFRNIFNLIDDLIVLNDTGEIKKNIPRHYPLKSELKKENHLEGLFLDLTMTIKDEKVI